MYRFLVAFVLFAACASVGVSQVVVDTEEDARNLRESLLNDESAIKSVIEIGYRKTKPLGSDELSLEIGKKWMGLDDVRTRREFIKRLTVSKKLANIPRWQDAILNEPRWDDSGTEEYTILWNERDRALATTACDVLIDLLVAKLTPLKFDFEVKAKSVGKISLGDYVLTYRQNGAGEVIQEVGKHHFIAFNGFDSRAKAADSIVVFTDRLYRNADSGLGLGFDKPLINEGSWWIYGTSNYESVQGPREAQCIVQVDDVLSMLVEKAKKQIPPGDQDEKRHPSIRQWVSVDGKFKTRAYLKRIDGDSSVLCKEDGTESVVPFSKLSMNDRNYVEVMKTLLPAFDGKHVNDLLKSQ